MPRPIEEIGMWRYAFVNFCFLMLALILLTLQHSVAGFGSVAAGSFFGGSAEWQKSKFTSDREDRPSSRTSASLSRAADWLDQNWHRVKIFDQWLIEYNTSQWEILRSSSPIETDLLQARYHVANAEVFTEAMREKTRAIKELDRAETWLAAMQNLVQPSFGSQMNSLKDEISRAESLEQAEVTIADVPFETIKTNLDHLIQTVRRPKN
jgi:hypothetical protein